MKIHFWGVRGSIPTPVTAEQIQAKISAAIARMTPKDAADEDSKEKFLATLPPHIFGTVGGNSACVEVKAEDGTEIVLDCGSGIRAMAKNGIPPADKHYNIFISHFHWDHIQGLPFFDASFNPATKIDLYSNYPAQERILEQQSSRPYFPKNGCWPSVKNQFKFHLVKENEPFKIGNLTINTHKMKHPGNSYSISIEENGKKFIYATDVELSEIDFDRNRKSNEFFKNADVLILDSQYTVEEAIQKENWGHSAYCYAIDFATTWNIKSVYLFHHEPTYDDRKIYSILEAAQRYAKYTTHTKTEVYLAIEGQIIEL